LSLSSRLKRENHFGKSHDVPNLKKMTLQKDEFESRFLEKRKIANTLLELDIGISDYPIFRYSDFELPDNYGPESKTEILEICFQNLKIRWQTSQAESTEHRQLFTTVERFNQYGP
jgi:hypothetical protein